MFYTYLRKSNNVSYFLIFFFLSITAAIYFYYDFLPHSGRFFPQPEVLIDGDIITSNPFNFKIYSLYPCLQIISYYIFSFILGFLLTRNVFSFKSFGVLFDTLSSFFWGYIFNVAVVRIFSFFIHFNYLTEVILIFDLFIIITICFLEKASEKEKKYSISFRIFFSLVAVTVVLIF